MSYTQILQQRAKKNVKTKALQQFAPYQILLAPLMTEKAYKWQENDMKEGSSKEKNKRYVFKVHHMSNKNDIKMAVMSLYNIKPLAVNIMNVISKGRSQRKLVRRAYKKAIVTLAKGQKIDV